MQLKGGQLETGSVIGGYRIDELISRGGMGVVYRATNVALNRIYALKVLAPELAADEQFRERFKREMRIAASLHHPSVVGIHYAGDQDGLLFFVMDFVHGHDLREVISRGGALDPARSVALLTQLAGALDAAHLRGLVHRDVKPANILITVRDGEEHAYLTDFGVAKRFDTASDLTARGAVVGTVDYMSPEQITGGEIDARTDIYALGCVFFQMLTGEVPYGRPNSVAKLFAHVHDPPPSLEGSLAELYPHFGSVIEQAMAKSPDDRFLSAGDFARAAEAALKGMSYTGKQTAVGRGEAAPSGVRDHSAPPEPIVAAEPTVAPDVAPLPREPVPKASAAEPDSAAAAPQPAAAPPQPAAAEPQPAAAEPQPAPAEPTAPPPASAKPAGVSEVIAPKSRPAREPVPETVAPPQPVAPQPVAPQPIASQPAPPAPQPVAAAPPAAAKDARERRWRLPVLALIVAIAIGAVVAVISSSGGGGGSSTSASGARFQATAQPVPTNRVTGSGAASVQLNGNQATVSVNTNGLLNGSPHAMHIHAGGQGTCPPASAARQHNHHLSISTTDGIKFYGPPVTSLTNSGDTSSASRVDFPRYPITGNVRYKRTITLPSGIASAVRAGNAVIVVHGIDYNGNGIYDNALDRSELNNALPGEATAPAICGPLFSSPSARAQAGASTRYVASLAPADSAAADDAVRRALLCHTPAPSPGKIS